MEILALLTDSLFTVANMPMSAGDVLGFASGLACVWLSARANIWNFPTGIFNCIILGLVFFQRRLFADALLQIVFIILAGIGWWKWIAGRHAKEYSPTFHSSSREQAILLGIATAVTLVLWRLLVWLNGASPPIDALITAMSLCAQWQLNRRQLSCWVWWIAVDVVSVPLYWSRELPLIAALYVIFLLICIQGWQRWRVLTLTGDGAA